MDGFTFPGMIDEPGCTAGRPDFVETRARAAGEQTEIARDFREVHGKRARSAPLNAAMSAHRLHQLHTVRARAQIKSRLFA